MNVFHDQQKFMLACDQTVGQVNYEQKLLYLRLIQEEFAELQQAASAKEELDALIDILVVTIGAIHSAGFDAEGAWNEVMRSNFSKIAADGKVKKREDGKVLKPPTYSPPDLEPYLTKQQSQ